MPTLYASFMDRRNFGPFLASKELLGEAVEIGTHRGLFAYELLGSWLGKKLYCVDHWAKDYDPEDGAGQGDRELDRRVAVAVLSPHRERVSIIRMESLSYAATVHDGALDFVYIDGCHQRAAVRADLNAWWPKVKTGGVLAGHDFVCPGEVEGGWGKYIQPEVCAFADSVRTPVWLVAEPTGCPWSWYLEKPK